MLMAIGFTQGKASTCVFHHQTRGIRTFVHGDDYVSTVMPEQLQWMKGKFEEKYQINIQWLGLGSDYQQEVNFVYRIITWDDQTGISFEADPRHAEITIEQFKLMETKGVSTPGTKEVGITIEDHDQELEESQASQNGVITARCKYFPR